MAAIHKKDVVIGQKYKAKIGNMLAVVRIDREGHRSGWEATNLCTGRAVHIKSAAKLQRVATDEDTAYLIQRREERREFLSERKAQYGF